MALTAWVVCSLAILAAPGAAAVPDTVVVCPPVFSKAIAPWIEYREAQGHVVAIVSEVGSKQAVRAHIRELARGGQLRHVLLVGDCPPVDAPPEGRYPSCVPTHYEAAKVNVRWGSEPEIATDNWYADLNDDHVPDLGIGRLPVDNPWQLAALVRKIIAYEESTDYGTWRRRINLVAGVGGFGMVADTVIDTATRRLVTEGVPPGYDLTLTQANWKSPYCPAPTAFNATTVQRLNEGSLFFVYLGHGFPHRLDTVETPAGEAPIFQAADCQLLRCQKGAPIGVFFACYTAAFDASRDCLAEDMLRCEGGPVAVVGGSRVTMPYAMSVLAMSLLDECFHQAPETLGEALLRAKRRMVLEQPQTTTRRLVDAVATVVSPEPNRLADERTEHLHLMNLLGDPLLRLNQPEPVVLRMPETVVAGEVIEVSGKSPCGGKCTLDFSQRRDRLSFTPPVRRRYDDSPASLAAFNETYRKANNSRLFEKTFDLDEGEFRVRLEVPGEARGACHVRVFIEGAETHALGAANVTVRSP